MPEWAQSVTFGIAVVGAVLGVISTWRAVTRDQPRLKVRAVWCSVRQEPTQMIEIATRQPGAVAQFPEGAIAVDAINIGYVSTYVSEVGLCPRQVHWMQRFREFKEPIGRFVLLSDAAEKVSLPYKLEPGARVRVRFARSAMNHKALSRAKVAYVMTNDERLFTGGASIIRAVVDMKGKPRSTQ